MADEQKQPWYKSLPGTLTAATGFIAAVSGLVAGLNQLGVFKHEQPAPQAVVTGPSGGAAAPGAPSSVASGGSSNAGGASAKGEESSTAPAGAATEGSRQPAPSTSTGPSRSAPSAPPAKPAPSPPSSKPAAAPAADTAAQPQRLPGGTSFELAVPGRICATGGAGKRFVARLAAPVRVGNATILPAGTTATLYLRKSGPATPDIRLDSLVRQKQAIAVPSADVKVTRGADGACLRAGARLAVKLGAPVTLRAGPR
jgi:hypothetical protein